MSFLFSPKKNAVPARTNDPFFNSLDDVFNAFWGATPTNLSKYIEDQQQLFNPSVEIEKNEDKLHVSAELPGLTPDDIDVHLESNNLIIEGEKKVEKKEEEKGRFYSERRYGHFRRSIPMPFEVDEEKIAARFDHGVLTVDLQKAEAAKAKTRRISIK